MSTAEEKGDAGSESRVGRLLAGPLFYVLGPLVLGVLVWLGSYVPFLQSLEHLTVDLRFRARAESDPPVDGRLLVVGITHADLERFGRWPWPRSVHGDLLTLFSHKAPGAVAYDVLFTEPEGEVNDRYFAEAAGQFGRVVVGAHADKSRVTEAEGKGVSLMNRTDWGVTKPLPRVEGDVSKVFGAERALLCVSPLEQSARMGFVNAVPSADGVFRRSLMVVRVGEELYPSLVTQALMVFWDLSPEDVVVRLGDEIIFEGTLQGDVRVPVDGEGFIPINWRNEDRFLYAPQTTSFDYGRLAQPLGQYLLANTPWPEDRPEPDGKLVVIGIAQPEGLIDLGASPYNPQSPKMLTHANVLNSILRGDYLREVAFWPALAVWLAVAVGTLLLLRKASIAVTISVPIAMAAAYVVTAFVLFKVESVVLPIAWPVLSFFVLHGSAVTGRWMQEAGAREAIKGVFSSYISPDIMEHLLDRPDLVNLTGESKPVTVFFSDIRSFTTISEGLEEGELVHQLNEYFEKMVDCLNRHQGTLHKYIGDAIMAVWGDVNWRGVYQQTPEETARNAVLSSLDMLRDLRELQGQWEAEGRPVFRIGIGVNHGQALVGDIGAPQRREFTVMGDTVNTASRLEGFTKKFGVEIVVSDSVKQLLGERFLTRTLALVAPKGKTQAVRLHEVLADLEANALPFEGAEEWVRRHEEGFQLFVARDFSRALDQFKSCAEERPGNLVCERYLEESQRYAETAPGVEWTAADVFAEEAKSK